MTDIEQKAKELMEAVNKQIAEAREDLARRMLENDMGPEMYAIVDNIQEVIKNPNTPYMCWPELKTRMNRAINQEDNI